MTPLVDWTGQALRQINPKKFSDGILLIDVLLMKLKLIDVLVE